MTDPTNDDNDEPEPIELPTAAELAARTGEIRVPVDLWIRPREDGTDI